MTWQTKLAMVSAFHLLGCTPPAVPQTYTLPELDLVGVIEGFYGTPWSHQDRLDILAFMGEVGLRDYVYAPKNDPFHRQRWRESYPPAAGENLQALVRAAQQHGVTLWYALSPGLSMTYSNASDFAALLHKIDELRDMGIAHFGLFLDDVPIALNQPADAERYATVADAHADLINRLYDAIGERGAHLIVTPTIYTNAWGGADYADRLGNNIPPEIPLVWTGPDVVAHNLTLEETNAWGAILHRRPLLWDNFPVNDFARWRLFFGPLQGRAPDLAHGLVGILANPMNEAHASMVPLATLAAYVRDPITYDPDMAWTQAVRQLYGEAALAPLTVFKTYYGPDAYDDHVFGPLYFPSNRIVVTPMTRALQELRTAATTLATLPSGGTQPLPPLVNELTPFIDNTTTQLNALLNNTLYEHHGDTLDYRSTLDEILVASVGTSTLDGIVSEWTGWRDLRGPTSANRQARVAFGIADSVLTIGISVTAPTVQPRPGSQIGEGDHIAVLIDHDPTDGPLGASDLVLLIPAGDTAVTAVSFPFQGFMAKYLGDNADLTFTEFHLTTFAQPPSPTVAPIANGLRVAATRTSRGYDTEIAIPLPGRQTVRLSLLVVSFADRKTVFSLPLRNYPAVPHTFVELRFPGR